MDVEIGTGKCRGGVSSLVRRGVIDPFQEFAEEHGDLGYGQSCLFHNPEAKCLMFGSP